MTICKLFIILRVKEYEQYFIYCRHKVLFLVSNLTSY